MIDSVNRFLISDCGCECHSDENVRHNRPCCAFTYMQVDNPAQHELNDLLDKYEHEDNEFGYAVRNFNRLQR